MLTMLTCLRLLSIVAWALVAGCLGRSAARAIRGRTYAFDNFRAAFFFVALVMIGFNLRWLLAPDDQGTWLALYALSVLAAFYVLKVVLAHGKGSNG